MASVALPSYCPKSAGLLHDTADLPIYAEPQAAPMAYVTLSVAPGSQAFYTDTADLSPMARPVQ